MNLLPFFFSTGANIYATFVQAVGLWMFSFLLVVLSRPVQREWFNAFATGFILLATAVSSLRVGFALGPASGKPFFFAYFLGEYLFLCFVIVGLRQLGQAAPIKHSRVLLLGAGVVAFGFSQFRDFSLAFVFQAGIMACGFFVALRFALQPPVRALSGLGPRLLRISLFVLGVGFAQYVPLLGAAVWGGRGLPGVYTAFMSVFDLLFEALLVFAVIVTGMEAVQLQLASAVERLEQARSKLDVLARTDPLTELMNRHAFAAVLDAPPSDGASGSVAVIDIDGLKVINDTYGHDAGDQAIRGFAGALRARLRADDLIFRWGGDEFLAVMFGLPPADANTRLRAIGQVEVMVEGSRIPVRVRASFGVAPFGAISELRAAASAADAVMYVAKRQDSVPAPTV